MDSQFQFEEMLFPFSSSSKGMNIEEEMNLFLGISPFQQVKAKSTEINDDIVSLEESTEMKKKYSFKTQTLETDHRSDSNFSGEPINSKKSKHHNFQKHTVAALKDIIHENEFQKMCQNIQALEATKALWTSFNNIKVKSILTKKFLSILFRTDTQSVTNLKEYGFKELFEKYSQEQIQESKNQLRLIVIKLFNNKSIENHVEKRSIQRKEQFKLYLINFREELKSSKIKKRISKESSDWIHTNAEINHWIL